MQKGVAMKRYNRVRLATIVMMAVVVLSMLCICEMALAQNAEEGMANFYSDAFHGKKMFNGEPYDKTKLTASHKKHAVGSKLKVTNLENNKSTVVTVTDRMAQKNSAVIDVSRRAAEDLGFVKAGKARVKVEAER
jgi:rare lipoprotein A